MKKLFIILLGVLVAALILSGCGGGNAAASNAQQAVKVAYLTPSLDVPFWRYMRHGIEDELKKLIPGVEVTTYDSKDSANTQLSNAQDALTKQVKAIIISPTDSASCVAVLDLAKDAKVPVVICDIGSDSGTYAAFISTDNEAGAKELGAYIASKLPPNSAVAQITLNQARINGVLRKNGFTAGVSVNSIKDIDFKQMEKVNREEGEKFAQDLITAHPDLKAIFCHSEDPSMGALAAIEASGRGDVLIAGFDCSPEVVDAIRAGKIAATAAQQPVLMGRHAAQSVDKLLKGEKVEPEIKLGTLLVTKDNINTVYDTLVEVALSD
ncbi:MAG: substrate-binding domain-containing protein [Spirochaetales bacterium]|jgi:ABC-type sugar transport system substrate-binding protein|nr:substrate-binding domain-containing protein [Spirochaetales bacterium]